jgi:hypothetical protein
MRTFALACFATLAATACSQGAPETTAQSREPIWEGEPSGESDDGVVFLIARGSKTSQCTATLVAPNLIITAKHCVVEFSSEPFSCTSEGELTSGSRGGAMGALIAPENISFVVGAEAARNPTPSALGLQIFSVATPSICRNDIAMVLLDREILDVPIVPMRLGQGNSRGEMLRVIGYGADHNGAFGTRNTLRDQRIVQVGVSAFLEDGDPVPPRTFMTVGPSLCIGDSGGPALTENEAITAVWSQLVGACGDDDARNYFTQIAPFEDTIVRPAFEAAGYEPLLEVEMGSGGAPTADAGTGGEPAGSGASGGVETSAGGAETGAGGGAPVEGGAGSAEGGTPSAPGGGDAGVGGEADTEPPAYRGPRKSGGLKCELAPGVRQDSHASGAALLLGLAWALRRARASKRGS